MNCLPNGELRHLEPSQFIEDWSPKPTQEASEASSEESESDCPAAQPFLAVQPTRMIQSVFLQLPELLQWRGVETCVLLIGPTESDVVTHCVLDQSLSRSSSHVSVGAEFMNETLKSFSPLGCNAKGITHSHPSGSTVPSGGDLEYVAKTMRNPRNVDCHLFLLPIFCDGKLWPYVVTRDESEKALLSDLILI